MNEDFVTFEQAVKLKELGFDLECNHHYDSLEFNHPLDETLDWVLYGETTFFKAPTLSQVHKWLFSEHDIYVEIIYDNREVSWYVHENGFEAEHLPDGEYFTNPWLALSNGINAALNILLSGK